MKNTGEIKMINSADKAVPEGWKSIAIKPPKHMVFCLNQKLDLKVFCYAYDEWSGEPKPWIEYWYDAPLPQPPTKGDQGMNLPPMANNQGWVCPKCGRVYSPIWVECTKCNTSSMSNTVGGTR